MFFLHDSKNSRGIERILLLGWWQRCSVGDRAHDFFAIVVFLNTIFTWGWAFVQLFHSSSLTFYTDGFSLFISNNADRTSVSFRLACYRWHSSICRPATNWIDSHSLSADRYWLETNIDFLIATIIELRALFSPLSANRFTNNASKNNGANGAKINRSLRLHSSSFFLRKHSTPAPLSPITLKPRSTPPFWYIAQPDERSSLYGAMPPLNRDTLTKLFPRWNPTQP